MDTNFAQLTAGETINGATTPTPVAVVTSDAKVYICNTTDAAKLKFAGFAVSNAVADDPINVQASGVVAGLTGLAPGKNYYVQADGTIGVAPGSYVIQVGLALSTTELAIIRK